MKTKMLKLHFITKNFFDRKWMEDTGVLHLFSIKNIFYDKMDLV